MKILLCVLTLALVTGCSSKEQLKTPSGAWQLINHAGFVPADAERYIRPKPTTTPELSEAVTAADYK